MKETLWFGCLVMSTLVACVQLYSLWALRTRATAPGRWLSMKWTSPFTDATLAALAVVAALFAASKAIEGFSAEEALACSVNAFVILMTVGWITDLVRSRTTA